MAHLILKLKVNCQFHAFYVACFWPSDKSSNSFLLLIGTRQTFWLILDETHINFSSLCLYSPGLWELITVIDRLVFEVGTWRYLNIFGATVIFFFSIKVKEVFPLPKRLDESALKCLQRSLQWNLKHALGRAQKGWAPARRDPLPAADWGSSMC